MDGPAILLYGEGWNFGDIANDARFVQATQRNMAGTGIGTFNDRLRDAVRGGSPLDGDPRHQGFGSGLYTAPNGASVNGSPEDQRARLLYYQDLIKVGLTGNLRATGSPHIAGRSGAALDPAHRPYNAQPERPSPTSTPTTTRRCSTRWPTSFPATPRWPTGSGCTAVAGHRALAQGPALVHAGTDRLRSKSLDRNSYNSGDWFNRLLWDCRDGNGFGARAAPGGRQPGLLEL